MVVSQTPQKKIKTKQALSEHCLPYRLAKIRKKLVSSVTYFPHFLVTDTYRGRGGKKSLQVWDAQALTWFSLVMTLRSSWRRRFSCMAMSRPRLASCKSSLTLSTWRRRLLISRSFSDRLSLAWLQRDQSASQFHTRNESHLMKNWTYLQKLRGGVIRMLKKLFQSFLSSLWQQGVGWGQYFS